MACLWIIRVYLRPPPPQHDNPRIDHKNHTKYQIILFLDVFIHVRIYSKTGRKIQFGEIIIGNYTVPSKFSQLLTLYKQSKKIKFPPETGYGGP